MAKVDPVDGDSAAFPASPNQGPVEARSLSSITTIASNPPAYPRNPAQKKLDPLVLYIVRVPGSKDVFLSPLKPPTKSSVSAEAINASLYYLHVATPDDDILLQECEQEREEQARLRREGLLPDPDMPLPSSEFARLNNVRRKPVPGLPTKANADVPPPPPPPPLPTRPPTRSQEQQEEQQLESSNRSFQIPDSKVPPVLPARPTSSGTFSPARATAHFTGGDRELFLDPIPTPGHPLPSVPQDENVFDKHAASKKPNRWSASGYISDRTPLSGREKFDGVSTGRHSLDTSRPQVWPRSMHEISSYARTRSPARSPGQSPSRRPHDSARLRQPKFHITVIRRDPAHGSQWNVATLSTHADGTGIDIEVSTPGYSRFAAMSEPLNLESLGLDLPFEARSLLSRPGLHLSQSNPSASADSSSPPKPSPPKRFRRTLVVSRPYTADDSRSSLDLSGNRASMDSSMSGSPVKAYGPGFSKLKSGYYAFTSPWNGICTFSTSVNGRSLKCKHLIPTPGLPHSSTSVSNHNHNHNHNHDNPPITVAEIRFNTPFQANYVHHQGSSHMSPFALSQTPTLKDSSSDPSSFSFPTSSNSSHNPLFAPSTPPSASSSSKRAALAHFLHQTTRHARRLSNSSTSSGGGGGGGGGSDPPPPRPPPPGDPKSYGSPERHAAPLRRPQSDDRLDLSLAREPAGGGMRGKSAKLGKLIIEDEGIKMLDLVVAACMGVWWRGYYC
ncbi:hypothetical protein ARAM_004149 [Aspergillus rambellii]|uniref:Uncharacterized protein n=1 Tax=Aspergillus rambellii TaxID=308745 RepID=A0A0F8V167_9EURO|nr:hypothetical protein ARAM_004149 [Aspergillus rambellii]